MMEAWHRRHSFARLSSRFPIRRSAVRAQIRYAICGGVAVTIHGATRSTKDIDILIAPTDVDKALDAVRAIGYKFAALPLVFDEGTARERHVQSVSKIEDGEHLSLDFLRGALVGRPS